MDELEDLQAEVVIVRPLSVGLLLFVDFVFDSLADRLMLVYFMLS